MNLPDRLRAALGPEAVITAASERIVYECDGYTIEKNRPDVVVFPRTTADVVAIVKICNEFDVPFLARGAGTSLAGGCLPVGGGVLIALTRMKTIHEINVRDRYVDRRSRRRQSATDPATDSARVSLRPRSVEPIGQHDRRQLRDQRRRAAHAQNGRHGQSRAGRRDRFARRHGRAHWRAGRFDGLRSHRRDRRLRRHVRHRHPHLGAHHAVARKPSAHCSVVFDSIDDTCNTITAIVGAGIIPAALEMIDQTILQAVEAAFHFGFPLDAGAVLIVEVDGIEAGLDREVEQIKKIAQEHGAREIRQAKDEAERLLLWKCRKQAFGALGRLAPSLCSQDGVVPRTKLPEMLRFINTVSDRHKIRIGNVFHAGDGNIHPCFLFDERDKDQIRRVLAASHEILEECIRLGGSVTGEHGIGVEKLDLMPKLFTPADLEQMLRLRSAFNPDNRCSRHKMFPTAGACAEKTTPKGVAV